MIFRAFRIAIDPGHGGKDEGMSFNGAIEKDITLGIAKAIMKFASDDVSLVLIRAEDKFMPAENRLRNSRHFDLYITIHTSFNEGLSPGSSVLYSGKGKHIKSSHGYADFFAQHFSDGKNLAQEAQTDLLLLDNLNCPGIQIVAGNLGAVSDFYSLIGQEGQEVVGKKIGDIIQILGQLKRNHDFEIDARSYRSRIDSLAQENMKKLKGKN